METAHTPIPWKKFGYTITEGVGKGYICIMSSNVKPPFHDADIEADRAQQDANAAYIVRAVNAHEELLEALKFARRIIGAETENDEAVEKIDAVLARVS